MKSILVAICFLMTYASCIQNYKKCLECFYEHRFDGSYFCKSSSICRGKFDTQCRASDIIKDYSGCVEGFQVCKNQTFTNQDFQAEFNHDKTIVPGFGCFLQMDRVANGSYGAMEVTVQEGQDQSNLMLFDDDNREATFSINDSLISYFTGMPYTNDGWKPKKLFIANRAASETASFHYAYMGAMTLKATFLAAAAILAVILN